METIMINYVLMAVASFAVFRMLAGIQSSRSAIWRGLESNLKHQPWKKDLLMDLIWPVTLPMTVGSFAISYVKYDGVSYDREIVKEMIKGSGKDNAKICIETPCKQIPDHVKDLLETKKYR
jgi:hypothetical protein